MSNEQMLEHPQVRTTFRAAREVHGVVRRARVIVAISLSDSDTEIEITINGVTLFMSDKEC